MCARYWPDLEDKKTYGKVQVENLRETVNPHYILREFLVHHKEVSVCIGGWRRYQGGVLEEVGGCEREAGRCGQPKGDTQPFVHSERISCAQEWR